MILNAALSTAGYAHGWGKVLLEEPGLYTESAMVVVVGIIFFTLGTMLSRKPKKNIVFSVIPLNKKDKTMLIIVAFIFFIPGNWAAYYAYNESLQSSFWERSASIASISNLLIPATLIAVIGIITSLKKGIAPLLIFGVILMLSVSGLLLLWSRRAILGIVFVLIIVLYTRKYGKPSQRVLLFLFPSLMLGAIFLSFFRLTVFFGSSIDDVTYLEMFEHYFSELWLESSAYSSLMYSIGPASDNTLLLGSSFLAAFIFYIPRAIFPDKPYSYDLGKVIDGDLTYNLPASFYGEAIANFSIYSIPIMAFILGYFLKKIDYKFYSKKRNIFELSIYLLLVFNVFFLVRGSFSTVFSAAVIVCLLPLISYYILLKIIKSNKNYKRYY